MENDKPTRVISLHKDRAGKIGQERLEAGLGGETCLTERKALPGPEAETGGKT